MCAAMKDNDMNDSEGLDMYQDFFARFKLGLYQTNNDDIITLANDAFANLYGYQLAQDVVSKDMKQFMVEPGRREEFKQELRKRGGLVPGYLGRHKNKTGDIFLFQ